ncbi:MAG TPA: hypothetical protein VL961_10490 [Acidimicrobiales bacterium]|nr:hypothetical protein [Acidimicrobiales bacterium]
MTSPFGITPVSGTPAVAEPRTSRGLLAAVLLTAAAVVAAGIALGVTALEHRLGGTRPPSRGHHRAATSTSTPKPRTLLTRAATTPTGATYSVGASTFTVTVRGGAHPSWVMIQPATGPALYAGVLAPALSTQGTASSSLEVEIGAGGTTITVAAGDLTQTLTPAVAPFTYTFMPR